MPRHAAACAPSVRILVSDSTPTSARHTDRFPCQQFAVRLFSNQIRDATRRHLPDSDHRTVVGELYARWARTLAQEAQADQRQDVRLSCRLRPKTYFQQFLKWRP